MAEDEDTRPSRLQLREQLIQEEKFGAGFDEVRAHGVQAPVLHALKQVRVRAHFPELHQNVLQPVLVLALSVAEHSIQIPAKDGLVHIPLALRKPGVSRKTVSYTTHRLTSDMGTYSTVSFFGGKLATSIFNRRNINGRNRR